MAQSTRVHMVMVSASLLFWFASSVYADFSGKVVGVNDGDSIRVMRNGKAEPVRLQGIDCPEKRQPFGTRAKQFTSEMVFGKDVTVKETGRDRYGRTLGDVMLSDGRNLKTCRDIPCIPHANHDVVIDQEIRNAINAGDGIVHNSSRIVRDQ